MTDLLHDGHLTRFTWHRALRTVTDRPFTAAARRRGTPVQTGHDPCTRHAVRALRRTGDIRAFVARAVADQPDAGTVYLDHLLILAHTGRVPAFQAAGRLVDAYTLKSPGPRTLRTLERLLALSVDLVTTDDADGFLRALAGIRSFRRTGGRCPAAPAAGR